MGQDVMMVKKTAFWQKHNWPKGKCTAWEPRVQATGRTREMRALTFKRV